MKLSDFKVYEPVQTGYVSLDTFLGGIPRGHFIEIFGRENSGKTTLQHNLVGAIQDALPEISTQIYDTEFNITPDYAADCGVHIDETDFIRKNTAEEVFQESLDFITKNAKKDRSSLVVIDSLVMSSIREKKKEFDGETMAEVARSVSKFLKLAAEPVAVSGSIVIFTNQVRDNLQSRFGGTTTPGGRAVRHYCRLRLQLYDLASSGELIKLGKEVIGQNISVTVVKVKNQIINRGFNFTLPMLFHGGFNKEIDAFRVAVSEGIVERKGSWYYLGDEKYQGEASVLEAMEKDPSLLNKIYEEMGLNL